MEGQTENSDPNMSDNIDSELSEDLSPENEPEPKPKHAETNQEPLNMSPGAVKLRSWLNKSFRVEMTDGRILIGIFLCTDRDANIILGSCSEYLPSEVNALNDEPRMLGLVMVPGKHIVSIHINPKEYKSEMKLPSKKGAEPEEVT